MRDLKDKKVHNQLARVMEVLYKNQSGTQN
jgi:hypothetical protein